MVTPLPRILAEEVALQSRDAKTSLDALSHPICWLTPILYWQGKQHNSRGDTLCPRSPGEAPPMGAAWFAPLGNIPGRECPLHLFAGDDMLYHLQAYAK